MGLYRTKLKYTNNSFLYMLDRFIGKELNETGIYEEIIIKYLIDHFVSKNPNGIMLDIGANMGVYSVIIGSLCPNIKVFSFEPHPDIFNILVNNTMKNDNIIAYNYAISNRNYCGKFYCDSINSGYNFLCDDRYIEKEEEKKQRHIYVPVRTLDTFNIDFSKVTLIKIDIEKFHGDIIEYLNKRILPGTIIIVENNDIDPVLLKDYDVDYLTGKAYETLICIKKS